MAAVEPSGGGRTSAPVDDNGAADIQPDHDSPTPSEHGHQTMVEVLIDEVRTSVAAGMRSGSDMDELLREALQGAGGSVASVASVFAHLETAVRQVKLLAEKCGDRGTLGTRTQKVESSVLAARANDAR